MSYLGVKRGQLILDEDEKLWAVIRVQNLKSGDKLTLLRSPDLEWAPAPMKDLPKGWFALDPSKIVHILTSETFA